MLVLILCTISLSFPSFKTSSSVKANVRTADVIIYGGTSAAITAAVQVKKMGKSVIIVSPDSHLGGLSSGGLGFTDTGNKEVIGGLSREFYQRLYAHYQDPEAWNWQKKKNMATKDKVLRQLMGLTVRCGYLSHMLPKRCLKILLRNINWRFFVMNGWIDQVTE